MKPTIPNSNWTNEPAPSLWEVRVNNWAFTRYDVNIRLNANTNLSSGPAMNYPDRKSTRPGTTRRMRLNGYDYSHPGYYFVTICTYSRQLLFGKISDGIMVLSPTGNMLENLIRQTEERFSTVTIDAFVVMPNHIHILVGLAVRTSDHPGVDNIGDVVRWIKDASVRRHSLGVKAKGWSIYHEHLWQKGFHDHIVRNEREMEQIRAYISTNVEAWEKDTFFDGVHPRA